MSGKGKKVQPKGKTQRNTEEQSDVKNWAEDKDEKQLPQELEEEGESSEEERPQQFTKRPSVADFDRTEVAQWETKQLKELSTEDVIKVLICRGEKDKNPVIAGGAEKILKQINREMLPKPFMSNGAPRGGSRGRGGFNPRFAQSDRPTYNNNYNNRDDRNNNNRDGNRDSGNRDDRSDRNTTERYSNYRGNNNNNYNNGRNQDRGHFDMRRRDEKGSERAESDDRH